MSTTMTEMWRMPGAFAGAWLSLSGLGGESNDFGAPIRGYAASLFRADVVEPDDAAYPVSFDLALA
jgi:hypothetical protein